MSSETYCENLECLNVLLKEWTQYGMTSTFKIIRRWQAIRRSDGAVHASHTVWCLSVCFVQCLYITLLYLRAGRLM